MYKGQWIHSLLYFKFVELTLNNVLVDIVPLSTVDLLVNVMS